MIVCRTLGPVAVSVDGGSAPPELLWRKNLALLVYLARSPKRARAREHLIGLLWGDKPEGAARHSLNEAVRVLRRHAGEGGVETEAGQVRLVAGAVELDTDRLDTLLAAKDYRSAVALVTGSVLAQFGRPLHRTVLLGLLVGVFDFAMYFLQMAVPGTELGWRPDIFILALASATITLLGVVRASAA